MGSLGCTRERMWPPLKGAAVRLLEDTRRVVRQLPDKARPVPSPGFDIGFMQLVG
jgi:hypothetical protein